MEEPGSNSKSQGPAMKRRKVVPLEPNLIINKALSNSMVVEGIMKNLPNKDVVKKFRLLNRKFNEIGSFLLQGRKGYDHLKGSYLLDSSLSDEQIEYLRLHGADVKRVDLDFRILLSPEIQEGTIRDILVGYLPQLEEIILYYAHKSIHVGDIRIPTGSILEENDILPNLQRIKMRPEFGPLSFCYKDRAGVGEFQRKFFRRLFQAATNLEEISDAGVTPRLFAEIQESSKWQAIKSFYWDFACKKSYSLKNFLAAKPALSELISHPYHGKLGEMLEFSQETLEKLEIGRSQLKDFDCRRLSNEFRLTKLRETDFSTANWLYTKIGAEKFERAVPNLKEVEIEGGGVARSRPTLPVLGSVESVRISMDIPDFPKISSFGQVFPTLSNVEVDWQACEILDNPDRMLWNLPATVKVIEMYNFQLGSYKDFGIDAFLTGIPLKKCKDLQKVKLEPGCLDQFEKSKGVLSLPNLHRLKFTCSKVNPNLLGENQFISYLSNQVLQEHPQDIKLIFSFLVANLKLENLANEVADLIEPVAQFGKISFHVWKHYYDDD